MRKIILASGSPRRKELLAQVGIECEVIPSDAEETICEQNPVKVVEELSHRKADDIAKQILDSNNYTNNAEIIIIGADTVVALEHQILGKPEDTDMAYRMLDALQGRSHSVFTGVTIIFIKNGKKRTETFHEETMVEVISMTREQIYAYIATGEPMDKAGAYGIQGAFAAYIRRIVGDYYNVVGLPVCQLVQRINRE